MQATVIVMYPATRGLSRMGLSYFSLLLQATEPAFPCFVSGVVCNGRVKIASPSFPGGSAILLAELCGGIHSSIVLILQRGLRVGGLPRPPASSVAEASFKPGVFWTAACSLHTVLC